MKRLRALFELGLATLGFLLLGQDVDVEVGQLRGKAHVLTTTADGEAQLLIRHHDLDLAGVFIENNLRHLGGLQRVHQEGRRILVPRDDVDLLALKLVDDRLHAGTAHTDAGADRVDGVVVGNHGDLRAAEPGSRATALISMMPS
jgi:hypothetical protein